MTSFDVIDGLLDDYVRRAIRRSGRAPLGFRCKTLAALGRIPEQRMSIMLSDYRLRQGRRPTRYVIACRGYGRAARWAILAKPGDDPAQVQDARVQATTWSAEDGAARIAKDTVCELLPGLHGTQRDHAIEAATRLMVNTAENMVEFVATMMTA